MAPFATLNPKPLNPNFPRSSPGMEKEQPNLRPLLLEANTIYKPVYFNQASSLVSELMRPKKASTFSFYRDDIVPKSGKCCDSATKQVGDLSMASGLGYTLNPKPIRCIPYPGSSPEGPSWTPRLLGKHPFVE